MTILTLNFSAAIAPLGYRGVPFSLSQVNHGDIYDIESHATSLMRKPLT